jgi:hypothetical protein
VCGACRIPVPLVIDQQAIMSLLVMYGLMPKADKRQFTDDSIRNASLEVIYDACGLLF